MDENGLTLDAWTIFPRSYIPVAGGSGDVGRAEGVALTSCVKGHVLDGFVVDQEDERDDELEIELVGSRGENRCAEEELDDLGQSTVDLVSSIRLGGVVICGGRIVRAVNLARYGIARTVRDQKYDRKEERRLCSQDERSAVSLPGQGVCPGLDPLDEAASSKHQLRFTSQKQTRRTS